MPANDKDFEEKCVVLFAGLLNDPNVKTVGARGFGQQGLDLLGRRDRDPNQPVGVQCKLKTKGDQLAAAEVRAEVAKALKVEPALTEYYIVTTASDDTKLDLLALELSQEQAKLGRTIDIQVFGWETLQQKIRADRKALDAFDPGHSAVTDELLRMSVQTLSVVEVNQDQGERLIQKMDALLLANPADTERGAALEEHLDRQIDEYRDLMNHGKPKTARELLAKLESQLTPQSSAAIRARVRGNLGWTNIRLGEAELGGAQLLEAYTINPSDPKTIGNRVLGLLLKGEVDAGLKFAAEALASDPTNVAAAAFTYQGAAMSDSEIDPDQIVPQAVRDDLMVAVHRLNYLRFQQRNAEWRGLAADLAAKHPDDDMVAQFAADAYLSEVFEEKAFDTSPAIPTGKKATLERALSILEPLWGRVRRYENAGEDQHWALPLNLAQGLRAIGRVEDAERVIKEGLEVAPSNPEALGLGVFLALERDDFPRALELLERVPAGPMKVVQRLNVLVRTKQWLAAQAWAEENPPQPDWAPDDRLHYDALVYQARTEGAGHASVLALSDTLISAWPDSVAILSLAAGRMVKVDEARGRAMRNRAFEMLGDRTPFADRLMLAQLASFEDDYDGVIKALNGAVPRDYPSHGLLRLTWAFANAVPRPATRRFLESLPPDVIERPEYARLAGAGHAARGDLPAAEKYLRLALAGEPSDLRATHLLYSVLQRQNRRDVAAGFILAVDETTQKGEPIELIRLAHHLRREGATERALALGYRVARSNPRNKDVCAAYPTLVLMAEDVPPDVTAARVVNIDIGFSLEGIGTPDVQGVIEGGGWNDSYDLQHPLAHALTGKEVGEEVTVDRPIGGALHYRVRDVRHKYLWLLQQISDQYASLFPGETSFLSMNVADGDVQPILDVAKQIGEPRQIVTKAYAESPLPLAAIAALTGKTVIEAAEMVAAGGGQVRVCVGAADEREAAFRAVKRARRAGAVIDTLALWTLHRFGLLEVAKTYFGRLLVPRSTMDTLLKLRAEREFHRGKEFITLGFEGEQAVRQHHSAEETEKTLRYIESVIQAVETHCEIRATDGAEDLRLDGEAIDRFEAGEVLDAIHLARAENLLLVSEDLHIRQLAASVGATRGAWVQVVLFELCRLGLIDEPQYCVHLGELAALKHGHLWLDGAVLAGLRRLDDPRKEGLWDASLAFIFGPGAEPTSHIGVVADFMVRALKEDLEPGGSGRAIGAILRRLMVTQPNWRSNLDYLEKVLRRSIHLLNPAADTARTYLLGWLKGHFLWKALRTPSPPLDPSTPQNRIAKTASPRAKGKRSRRSR